MDRSSLLERARTRGVNPLVYWLVRAVLQPFFHVWLRMSRVGREHVPAEGPVIFAANHRSFLDPFMIATLARRPIYFVAKQELFHNPVIGWFLNCLGAFPIDRGRADKDAMATAREILERGDGVLIFPEGTRIRTGTLSRPKRGVGRLALETGAPVVPIAITGTEHVRRGWRIRPRKVSIRAGRPLTFPVVQAPTPALAQAVTDRIWPMVELQWEWLGGLPRVRRAAVLGAGSWGTALAVALARAGLEVELGTRSREQAMELDAQRRNVRYLPGVELPAEVVPLACEDVDLDRHDLVVLAVPSRSLPALVAAHGARIPERAGVLVLAKGLVAPVGALPTAYVAERVPARAVAALGGPGHAADALAHGAALVVATADAAFAAQLHDVLTEAGMLVETTRDVVGVELAAAGKNAAVLAAATAASAGPNAAGAAAGRVFAEVDRLARARGGHPETFSGLAGAGDLVASVIAESGRNRRAGELLGRGTPVAEIGARIGQTAEALDALPLLADALERAGVHAPTTRGLADVVTGTRAAGDWVEHVTAPAPRTTRRRAA